jgi:hypothetical protein
MSGPALATQRATGSGASPSRPGGVAGEFYGKGVRLAEFHGPVLQRPAGDMAAMRLVGAEEVEMRADEVDAC